MSDRVNEALPTTEAGRALLDASDVLLMLSGNEIIGLNEGELELQILAIEREAAERATAAVDVERLTEAIEAMKVPGHEHLNPMDDWISVGVVRSILEGKHPILARLSGESE